MLTLRLVASSARARASSARLVSPWLGRYGFARRLSTILVRFPTLFPNRDRGRSRCLSSASRRGHRVGVSTRLPVHPSPYHGVLSKGSGWLVVMRVSGGR